MKGKERLFIFFPLVPFGMSSVSLATVFSPPEPLGSRIVRGEKSMLFLHRHLSLSPHNDSPCSPLLMFVIALSHKGG